MGFFQVLTGESWSEAVARPAIWFFHDQPLHAAGGGLFFVSYVLITAQILTNVVVAVLLDKMVDPEVAAQATPEGVDRRPSTGSDSGTDGIQGATLQNGEEYQGTPTVADLNRTMVSVERQVEQMMSAHDRMSLEIDSFRGDMISMGEQVASIMQ